MPHGTETTQQLVDGVLALIQRLAALPAAQLAQAAADARALEVRIAAASALWLALPPTAHATEVGVQLAQAAIEIGPASKALATASQWWARTPAPTVVERVVQINTGFARASLLRTFGPLAKLPPDESWAAACPAAPAVPEPAAPALPADMDLDVLRNIALYHREHERYYTLDITESAADLYREANKLRIVAGVWLAGGGEAPRAGIDFRLPQYQAAGSPDLNALSAIAAIGVLFMEGDAEPAELRVIKGKLQALAGAWSHVGRWLADKMDAAWEREQATCTPALIGVVQARFSTITTNWRGAREMSLTGVLLGRVVAQLNAIDFSPAALRANRAESGRKLLETAWALSLAAQIRARSAADLAENDRNWTTYLDGLPSNPAQGNS